MSTPRLDETSGALALSRFLPPLLVAAERVAATVIQGIHGRRRSGPGETFWQFRRHQPGDPARLIDWRRSARSDPLFVREREWAAAQSVWLWQDGSASMAWRSKPSLPLKQERASLLLLALSALLLRAGERVALLGDGARPLSGVSSLEKLAHSLSGQAPCGLPPDAVLPRHAGIVLAGDFLAPPGVWQAALEALAAKGARGHLLLIADPAEESFPYGGRVRLEGVEGEGHAVIERAEEVRPAYERRLSAHRGALASLASRLGWGFMIHRTDQPPETALLALYQSLGGL